MAPSVHLARALLPLLLVATGCGTLRSSGQVLGIGTKENEATVVFHTAQGTELGVSTDYGLVFLGRGAHAGPIEWTVWFADGPSVESGTIEPVGGGLYTTASEIRLPTVPLTFVAPQDGASVTVVGRRGSDVWEEGAEVVRHPQVEGLLLEPGVGGLDGDQVGAGVYLEREGRRHLLGLVSGRLRLTAGGRSADYLTVVGPEGLWRLVTYARNVAPPRRVYREDVL